MSPGARLPQLLAELREHDWVDLTHAFAPSIPHSPLFTPERRTLIYDYEAGDGRPGSGFRAHRYDLVGQWGTHVDPPSHFARGGRSQDDLRLDEMLLELVVIDVRADVARDPDYCVSLADLHGWEATHGPVPAGSFVALCTGWDERWPDVDAMRNLDADGVAHSPGWSREVLETLYEQRGVTATGHDMTDTDAGVVTSAGDAPLERYILESDHYQLELLSNLDRVSPTGSLIIATWPKAEAGSGFPARAFAITPRS